MIPSRRQRAPVLFDGASSRTSRSKVRAGIPFSSQRWTVAARATRTGAGLGGLMERRARSGMRPSLAQRAPVPFEGAKSRTSLSKVRGAMPSRSHRWTVDRLARGLLLPATAPHEVLDLPSRAGYLFRSQRWFRPHTFFPLVAPPLLLLWVPRKNRSGSGGASALWSGGQVMRETQR